MQGLGNRGAAALWNMHVKAGFAQVTRKARGAAARICAKATGRVVICEHVPPGLRPPAHRHSINIFILTIRQGVNPPMASVILPKGRPKSVGGKLRLLEAGPGPYREE